MVKLEKYPKFAAYVEKHRERIAGRNVSKRSPHAWYRTIDRIYESLTWRPKLLIPDIKGSAHVVYEEGRLYPHHNLYYISSDTWDLRALQSVLSSRLAFAFIAAYSPKMRGGNLRFQAQYLRRIRLPKWEQVPQHLREDLAVAAKAGDLQAMDEAVRELYGLDAATWARLAPVSADALAA